MLFASGNRCFASAEIAWSIAFSTTVWWLVVERKGLVFDTRWVPAVRSPATANACVYLLLDGTLELHTHRTEIFAAPAAFILSEAQLEGASASRSMTYRCSGEPFTSVQIHCAASAFAVEASTAPRELDAEAWSAARSVATASRSAAEDSLVPMQRLMALLVESGVLRAEASLPAFEQTPDLLARVWRGVRPMIERLYLAPTVAEVSTATGISVRQIDRSVAAFLARFGDIGGTGWRHVTRHMRLKLAVLLLSAEQVSIAEVAAVTGYGSSDAMARAFRDAGLPPPNKVKSNVRERQRT